MFLGDAMRKTIYILLLFVVFQNCNPDTVKTIDYQDYKNQQ